MERVLLAAQIVPVVSLQSFFAWAVNCYVIFSSVSQSFPHFFCLYLLYPNFAVTVNVVITAIFVDAKITLCRPY